MPPKIRDLERRLRHAGFRRAKAKGSHRKWRHPSGVVIILSGDGGDDAKPYQEDGVEEALTRAGARL
jgi:predicted RNA binding protein YcfA (HicA-like mRNA interferase family)